MSQEYANELQKLENSQKLIKEKIKRLKKEADKHRKDKVYALVDDFYRKDFADFDLEDFKARLKDIFEYSAKNLN